MDPSTSKQSGSSTSRRQFLHQAGGVAAGSALAGLALPAVHAGENNTIKLALIGCGSRGTGAVDDAFHTTGGPVKLYAMADLFSERLQGSLNNLANNHKDKIDVSRDRQFLGFDAYKKAIDSLSPGDVAMLTTHAAFRPLHFEYAVARGVNVFMEKSFAVDAPATRRMQKAAEEADRKQLKISVGFMWRHSQARQEVIKRIHDGAIGDVQSLRIYREHGPTYCPKAPTTGNELAFQIQHAFSFNWTCSGFHIDWHCHNIDVACWAKNAWPVSAQGMGGRCYPECGNLFDHYSVEYTFADGTKLYAFSRHMKDCWETYADYAHGTKGAAVIMTSLNGPDPKIYRNQRMEKEDILWRYGKNEVNPYHREWQVLLDAIRQNKTHNEAHRAIQANFTGLMGRAAVHTGQMVDRDQMVNSQFEYVRDIDHMTFATPAPIKAGPDGIYPAPQPGITKEI